jgi:hypothetical protein
LTRIGDSRIGKSLNRYALSVEEREQWAGRWHCAIGFSGGGLRSAASAEKDGAAARRILALALVLDADRVQAETFGDAGLHQLQDALDRGLGILGRNEVEVALAGRRNETGHRALIDAMGVDPALGGLPEHLCQSHYGHSARADDVGEYLPRSDGWQLVDIADDQQRRVVWRPS